MSQNERYIVAALDPRTGTHRIVGPVMGNLPGEDVPRLTVPAAAIDSMARHLAPLAHEKALVLTVRFEDTPAPPRQPLRSV